VGENGPVLVCRHQALVRAPLLSVWDLVGDPRRHPEWWPEVLEVQGKRFGEGCTYCQTAREADGTAEKTFLLEKLDEGREIVVRCLETGLFMHWVMADAQGGTFIDAEFGFDLERATADTGDFDPAAAKQELKAWLQQSLDALVDAAELRPAEADDSTSATARRHL
jgi:polyketide cyclase/dehydrase/lipid transport protein